MGKLSKSSVVLGFTIAVILMVCCDHMIMAEGEECASDLAGLINKCAQYVGIPGHKIPPSKECCGVIQKANLPCVCKHINSDVEKAISMDKVVYVAAFCGRPLKHGSKCRSFAVPME